MPISTPFNVLSGGLQDITPSGGVPVGGPGLSTDNALVRWNGTTGDLVQNGVVTEADFTGTLTGPTDQATTTAAGLAFTNQPANDGIEVLSSDAGDTTQTVTIIGTTNGSDTVVVETVTLNGTTPVATVKVDWGVVLAVKKSAVTLGTVTVREASADQTITAGLTAAVLSVGVTTVSNTAAFNRVLSMVASGATTKQLGFQGTNSAGTVIYDSQALTGTTVAVSNSQFLTLTEIYRGDLEATRTATVTTDGSWVLTGASGQTLSFDSPTGNISLTPGTGGVARISASAARLDLISTGGGSTWKVQSFTDGKLYIGIPSVADMASFDGAANGNIAFAPRGTGGTLFSGNVLLNGLAVNATGALQLPNHATSAGGIALGTGAFIFALTSGGEGIKTSGSITPQTVVTGSAPAYVEGKIYYDLTLHKLRVGGATGYETITSV